MKVISTEKAPAAIGPYSQGIISGGLFFALFPALVDRRNRNNVVIYFLNLKRREKAGKKRCGVPSPPYRLHRDIFMIRKALFPSSNWLQSVFFYHS